MHKITMPLEKVLLIIRKSRLGFSISVTYL